MNRKTVSAVLALCFILLCFSACGSGGKGFKVDYVGQPSILNPNMYLAGKYDGQELKLGFDAFEGCKFSDMEYIDGENVTFSGTDDGELMISGGIRLTLTDADGGTHTFDVKPGSTFDVVEKDGKTYLVLPD